MDTLNEQKVFVFPELNQLHDRCCRCGAEALVRVHKVIDDKPMDILFCGHHFAKNEPALAANGWDVQDERHRVNVKPVSGVAWDVQEVD